MKTVGDYRCGPQSWPQWIRKIFSRFYNRACHIHDDDYGNPEVTHAEAESKFKKHVKRKRRGLRKAWKRGKIGFFIYVVHGLVFGYIMPFSTRRFGKFFKIS